MEAKELAASSCETDLCHPLAIAMSRESAMILYSCGCINYSLIYRLTEWVFGVAADLQVNRITYLSVCRSLDQITVILYGFSFHDEWFQGYLFCLAVAKPCSCLYSCEAKFISVD